MTPLPSTNESLLHFFQQKAASLKATGRNASVCLMADMNGYVAYGSDAEKCFKLLGNLCRKSVLVADVFDDFSTATISLAHMLQAVNKLTEAGHSVSLVDTVPSTKEMKPYTVLVCVVAAKHPPARDGFDKWAASLDEKEPDSTDWDL